MKKIKILQEKQKNGLWGTPYDCYKIDKFVLLDDRKWLLNSAIIAAVSQEHNRRFEICFSGVEGFVIFIPDCPGPSNFYRISYNNYEVVDNILYEFENEQEHLIFLRKEKLEILELLSETLKQT